MSGHNSLRLASHVGYQGVTVKMEAQSQYSELHLVCAGHCLQAHLGKYQGIMTKVSYSVILKCGFKIHRKV